MLAQLETDATRRLVADAESSTPLPASSSRFDALQWLRVGSTADTAG